MDFDNQPTGQPTGDMPPRPARKGGQSPAWAAGLRQLYDQVIDEPLPDSFRDLLDKLDQPDR